MSEKKLVIFDLDGTLLYTVPDIAAATNQALAACGYPVHSEEEIASYIGNGKGHCRKKPAARKRFCASGACSCLTTASTAPT